MRECPEKTLESGCQVLATRRVSNGDGGHFRQAAMAPTASMEDGVRSCMALLFVPRQLLRVPRLLTRIPRQANGGPNFVRLQGNSRHRWTRPVRSRDECLLAKDDVDESAENHEAPPANQGHHNGGHQSPRLDVRCLRKRRLCLPNRRLGRRSLAAVATLAACRIIATLAARKGLHAFPSHDVLHTRDALLENVQEVRVR
mmetsp:Transcript_5537/g.12591  ORF Transcript_5537/g.12591 Transcript_5537/m.12591 type:complete len:200 (+) Transcript_5537:714-1313(+)